MKLPGLCDIHVHFREPGAAHKEDWSTGTAAALAGGFTTTLAMPNTNPPVTDTDTFQNTLKTAQQKARCDFAIYMGACQDNAETAANLWHHTAGLKMYLDQTYGPLQLEGMHIWMKHFAAWPSTRPVTVHAEKQSIGAAILLSQLFKKPIHICHVSRKEEILLIREAKKNGLPVTCEVCPHHLFLTKEDIPSTGGNKWGVCPPLAEKTDQEALWANMDIIDAVATDHAPHTIEEKEGENPPPGFPGLETALPLMLTAVREKRLSMDDIIRLMHTRPRQIFDISDQADTHIEIDLDSQYEIRGEHMQTKCRWTPFEGWQVYGRIIRVVLRGHEVFKDGKILALPGSGHHIRG